MADNFNTNEEQSINEDLLTKIKYLNTFEKSRKINSFISLAFILIGLIGHSLTIYVFVQKRFRKNSSNVYLLCLAINDALFLIIHFFEDTIKTFKEFYLKENHQNVLHAINITDRFVLACYLINYLRYVLRFTSAYIIIAFTIQRLYLVHSPFSRKFKSTKSGWKTVGLIVIISLLINLWVPFLFEIQSNQTCQVKNESNREYFIFTLIYISLIMLIPIIIIFICNSIIINCLMKTVANKNGLRRNTKLNDENSCLTENSTNNEIKKHSLIISVDANKKSSIRSNNTNSKPYYLSINQIIRRVAHKASSPIKITKMLILVSFSYAFLNLPYLISWSIYNYKFISVFTDIDELFDKSDWLSVVKISEIFNLLNYSIHFYINYASGSVFRNQLRYSSKFITI